MEKEKSANHIMNCPLDKLLQLVDEGDPNTILDEENLTATFNELVKYGLITIEDEQVYLTAEGKLAKEEGVQNFIEKLQQEQVQVEPIDQPRKTPVVEPPFSVRNKRLWSWSLMLLMLLSLLFSLLHLPE